MRRLPVQRLQNIQSPSKALLIMHMSNVHVKQSDSFLSQRIGCHSPNRLLAYEEAPIVAGGPNGLKEPLSVATPPVKGDLALMSLLCSSLDAFNQSA